MNGVLFKSAACFAFLTAAISLNADTWNADAYHQNSSSQKNAASDLLKYVAIQKDWSILDVGCGDGKITAGLAESVIAGKVTGLDISPSMIDFAKEHYREACYPNLQFVLGDAENIAYESQFDAVLSFTALQWVQNHEAFIQGAHKALKGSGVLAVTMPLGLPESLQQAVLEITAKPEWSSFYSNFSTGWNFPEERTYGDLLRKNGFFVSRLAIVPQVDIFPTRQVFEKFISQWFPYLHPLPGPLKNQFLKDVVDRYLYLSQFPKGEVHFKIRRLEVVAMKSDWIN